MKARDEKKTNFYYFLSLHFWQQYKFLVEMFSSSNYSIFSSNINVFVFFFSSFYSIFGSNINFWMVIFSASYYSFTISFSLLIYAQTEEGRQAKFEFLVQFWEKWYFCIETVLSEINCNKSSRPDNIHV